MLLLSRRPDAADVDVPAPIFRDDPHTFKQKVGN
jgi:hypothetical protein